MSEALRISSGGILAALAVMALSPGCRSVESGAMEAIDRSPGAPQMSSAGSTLEHGPYLEQLKAVRVGWSKDLVIEKLGRPGQEQPDGLSYVPVDSLSEGGYLWRYTFKTRDGVVVAIEKEWCCVMR